MAELTKQEYLDLLVKEHKQELKDIQGMKVAELSELYTRLNEQKEKEVEKSDAQNAQAPPPPPPINAEKVSHAKVDIIDRAPQEEQGAKQVKCIKEYKNLFIAGKRYSGFVGKTYRLPSEVAYRLRKSGYVQ